VVAVAVVAALSATAYGDLIALLATFAFGTFGAALTPCLAIGLNWRRATPTAAVASIATGLGGTLGLEMVSRLPGSPLAGWLPGVLPAAVSLAASFVVFLGVSWVTGSEEGDDLDPDVAGVMDA
jgi:Na+(H+)/acetate symporter ActP